MSLRIQSNGDWSIPMKNAHRKHSFQKLTMYIALMLVAATNISFADAVSREGLREVEGAKDAKIYRQFEQRFSRSAFNRGLEGWILLNFTVETNGTANNIEIIDQSAPGYLEETAIRTVKAWRYYPATLNGEPVVQSKRNVLLPFRFDYYIEEPSQYFIGQFESTVAALSQDDLAVAETHISNIESKRRLNYHEAQLAFTLRAQLDLKTGDVNSAIQNLERFLYYSEWTVEDEKLLEFAPQLFLLQAKNNRLTNALLTHAWIEWLEPPEITEEIKQVRHQIVDHLSSPNPISFQGLISDRCPECKETNSIWRHDLFRAKFSIDKVKGSVDGLRLYCDFYFGEIEIQPGLTIETNENWGSCDVIVYGTEGTTFRLVERH